MSVYTFVLGGAIVFEFPALTWSEITGCWTSQASNIIFLGGWCVQARQPQLAAEECGVCDQTVDS